MDATYAIAIYIIIVTAIALNVPTGIALRGFFKSPDKLTPAIIPVTAGKKTAKTYKKFSSSNEPIMWTFSTASEGVRKNENKDNPIITIMKYCTLIAKCALI